MAYGTERSVVILAIGHAPYAVGLHVGGCRATGISLPLWRNATTLQRTTTDSQARIGSRSGHRLSAIRPMLSSRACIMDGIALADSN